MSTYDLLTGRLETAARELAKRANSLNQARMESFGTSELRLLSTERVRTAANNVPRDVSRVGDQMILGFNPAPGTITTTRPTDVFAVHRVDTEGSIAIRANPNGLADSVLDDDQFIRDFDELYTYYAAASLRQLYRTPNRLLAVFSIGNGASDIRVLRWSLDADGSISYMDSRGQRDHVVPPRHDVEWVTVTRSDFVDASHISLADKVLVDPLGGSITLSLPDGTVLLSDEAGHSDQSLEDCTLRWAQAGEMIIVDLLAYGEARHRFYLVNLLDHSARRIDELGQAFRRLPGDQGLIYPKGLYLANGHSQFFDLDGDRMELLEVVRAPNGEDVLYVFYEQNSGRSILLPYNMVRQEVSTPLWCHGHTFFDDGTMIMFREEPEATRTHPLQVWESPFCSQEYFDAQPRESTELDRIGNPNLVAGIADALSLSRLINDVEATSETYGELLGAAARFRDRHHWANEVGQLDEPVAEIENLATQVISEFERTLAKRALASEQLESVGVLLRHHLDNEKVAPPASTEDYIANLANYRSVLGRLRTLVDTPESDLEAIAELNETAATAHSATAQAAASFLATDGAFDSYHEAIADATDSVQSSSRSVEAASILEEIDQISESMDLVASTVGDLVVDDPTVRTSVLEQVSSVLAGLNAARSVAESRLDDLIGQETGASFATELGLFGQSIASAVGRADTPEACDEALSRLLIQLETLETSGPRTDEQLDELAKRREAVTSAVSARRQKLVDARAERAGRLVAAAERNLERVGERAAELANADEVNGFFAADPMATRIVGLADQLRNMGEEVKADELESRLGAERQSAIRTIRDRVDLFEGDLLRLGRHKFSVNSQRRELTVVPGPSVVLTGTDLTISIHDERLDEFAELWDQPLASESKELYRSVFLAGTLLIEQLRTGATDPDWMALVHAYADSHLDEGYDRGVHDADALALLNTWWPVASEAGTLTFSSRGRARDLWAWNQNPDQELWLQRGQAAAALGQPLNSGLGAFLDAELTAKRFAPLVSTEVASHVRKLRLDPTIESILGQDSVLTMLVGHLKARVPSELADEVAVTLLTPDIERLERSVSMVCTTSGLIGRHATITDGAIELRLDDALEMVVRHSREVVPRHRDLLTAKGQVLTEQAERLSISNLSPSVPEGFVRNRLVDEVYLPLIGDNLSRQIGTADDTSGARSGLLMLLSPPGYGKTTLTEYVADRLGMALVKVSGPSIGHDVTSLDPAMAPSATSTREIERINMAFAIGSNVILYLDDIQHTSSEFLQRFISLTDAQRRVEGVWEGESRTFDLRGKRFAVVMAGNPYTESGERFRIPDMLANRADTYNLGDFAAESEHLFASSYLENAVTANPVTAALGSDLAVFLAGLDGGVIDESRLANRYDPGAMEEVLALLGHLKTVSETVLMVNRAYIASAATADAYRTEPPFLLQGSYRNMSRMASKLLPAMNDGEVEEVIVEHYSAEAQSLTSAAESNLLKLGEMRGTLNDEQTKRWNEILATFRRAQRLGGGDDDPVTRVVAAIGDVADALVAKERSETGEAPNPWY